MEKLIKDGLRESYDWVILDSAPLLAVADAAAAARWVDGVLMVTHAGFSTRDAARESREQLQNVGARILGVIIWGREEKKSARGGYDVYSAGDGASPTG
jgi:Mrp family chromosome partitioning ATPase